MNNPNDILKEFGPDFCLYPFLGAFYSVVQDNNNLPSIRPCCLISPSDRYAPVNNSIHETVNSPGWKSIRKDFVAGKFKEIKDCSICINSERMSGTSTRLGSLKYLTEHIDQDIISIIKEIIENDYTVNKLFSLDYFPSNYCNFSCIMCHGGSSTSRRLFEIKVLNSDTPKTTLIPLADDFYSVLEDIETLNFAGGETLIQPEVHKLLDHLIDRDLAKKITIFLLTNASDFPDHLEERFSHFKKVVYMCSVDGTGAVLEYQRRGATWTTVEKNTLKLVHHSKISTVVNYVLTAVNAVQFVDFADWCYDNHVEFVSISSVFRAHGLEVSAMPNGLRQLTLDRLINAQAKYSSDSSRIGQSVLKLITQVYDIINANPYNPDKFNLFVDHITKEDSVSKLTLVEAVPEWAPYFKVDH